MDFALRCFWELRELLEEGEDFLIELLAGAIPLFAPTEDEGALANVFEAEFFASTVLKVVHFFLQGAEEDEFEAVPCFASGAGERDADGGSEGLEVIRDGFAADAAEHAAHSGVEVLDGEHTPRAFVLEVVEDAVADVFDEREVGAVGSSGGAEEGVSDPLCVVTAHLVATDLEDGKLSSETDHAVFNL